MKKYTKTETSSHYMHFDWTSVQAFSDWLYVCINGVYDGKIKSVQYETIGEIIRRYNTAFINKLKKEITK